MPFSSSWQWHENPGLDAATQYGQQGVQAWADQHSKGENFYKRILKSAKRGDYSVLGNPFSSQEAAANRLAASHMDPFLPPELAKAQQRVAEARNAENASVGFENYVRDMLTNAAQGTMNASQARAAGLANAYGNLGQMQLGGYQGERVGGWGSALMGGLLGGAKAAAGLGWSPFG